MHARGMDDVTRAQLTPARDGSFSNLHGSVRIALALNRGTTAVADRACDTSTEEQIVVGRVDDRIYALLHQVARDDQDFRRCQSSTSRTRSSNSLRVALAMPLTPTAEMVIDAQATPHTSASCRPLLRPPVLNQRASIPPASASPAPVVSTAGRSVRAGIPTTPYSVYAARPSAPALITRPFSHHCRRNSSGSVPPSDVNSSRLHKYPPAFPRTSRTSGGRAWTYYSISSAPT